MARGLELKPEATAQRRAYYERIGPYALAPLWEQLSNLLIPEPRVRAVPHLWRYDEIRPHLLASAALITAEEAERRVLILENPALKGEAAISDALFAGLQLIMPGEVAPTHRHSPCALRFIIEGAGGYTAIDGEKAWMAPGDLILTPSGTWHDHGNEGTEAVVWLDGLDLPLVRFLGPVFAEPYEGGRRHPPGRPAGDNIARYGANMLPLGAAFESANSPVFHYPYARTREALAALQRSGEADPCHGIKMQYVNPASGGPAMPTIASYMQLLPAGFAGETWRSTAAWVYAVVEGTGRTVIGEAAIDWGPRDVFVVPGWHPHRHEAGEDAVLFSFTDAPVHRALGLYRERRGNVTE